MTGRALAAYVLGSEGERGEGERERQREGEKERGRERERTFLESSVSASVGYSKIILPCASDCCSGCGTRGGYSLDMYIP